ncbi:hypothetical protein L228DRAFT_3439 [Xylona heveae TC161]|uniref:DUF2235 domain-containing protein n=1 Tax=Xylona heveae (strain CBS 132557 / TC161) TaxID=1328760 RepID=A0A165JC05_XYLHT|nr:hypothetical protein L228DRAFT_3439 [Xylona heveae TC161]KZF26032.1 hypothetical protein L228DRAFT_3439 [Xylona heveae TC161]
MSVVQNPPKRLIYCVDGTWCGPDGASHAGSTLTNVYQIYVSIHDSSKSGTCSQDGFFQQPMYEPGIGSADDTHSMERIMSGVFGEGYLQQIKKIYETCCRLSSEDEVWLFGFSRGAFVVRAVAGLLHYLRAISSAGTPQFAEDYKTALKVYATFQKQSKLGPGQIHSYFSATTRKPPKIKFIGAFDTVKAVNDRFLFDISFNDSILHLRHALALHEDRKAMTPEYIYPDLRNRLGERSIVQAWFAGAHIDMGGSAAKAGLSLYPLQWMLLESQSLGLALSFHGTFGGRASIDNPLRLVFPVTEEQGKGADMWTCRMENGLEIKMQDIRRVHGLERYEGRYSIKLNRHHATLWPKERRKVVNSEGSLNGWSFFPQGTVIHPSVFLLMDESINISLDTKDLKLHNSIEHCRKQVMGTKSNILNTGFWNDQPTPEFDHLGAIRVLVCGNTGVGKSTLINKVFGVPLTGESSRERGIHDIRKEIRYDDRPDLIVHDSGGFEAGATGEISVVQNFLKEKSTTAEIDDRLHVIWFCIDMPSPRTKQNATLELFKAVSEYAQEVPIIVVVTKMDEFFGAKFYERRTLLTRNRQPVVMEDCDRYAEDQVRERVTLIRAEMLAVHNGRLDACVPISRDDEDSIKNLTDTTSRCFSSEKVRILYIRAQVSRIELKMDLAIGEVMRTYKRSLRGATAVAGIPILPTTTRASSAVDVCRTIIACFGLPFLSGETALQIVKINVWDDLTNNMIVVLSEGIALVGVGASVLLGGMPVFLASSALNIPLVVPATARLLLMLAADLILILAKSFRDASAKNIGQPLASDLRVAARAYRPVVGEVHRKIKKLVPRRNLVACYRTDKVREGFENIIEEYKNKVVDDIPVPSAERFDESDNASESDLASTDTLIDDAKDILVEVKKDQLGA